MGNDLLVFLREKARPRWKIAFLAGFVITLLVHLYKFTNNLPFFDSYYNAYSSQNMVASGRWFLSVACGFSSFFDLPWLIGLFCAVFIGCTAAVLAEIFEMDNPCLIVLSAALLAAFPGVTETMFFEYTADGYMLAMLLSALSVCASRMEHCGSRKQFFLSAALLCLSCGIYQSYVSFAFILAVCYFIGILLQGRCDTRRCLHWVLFQAGIYGLGLLAYWLIWQLLLRLNGIGAVTYQGLSDIGGVSAGYLLDAAKSALITFLQFLIERNPLTQGWTVYSALSCATVCACLLGLGAALVRGRGYTRPGMLALLLLCLAAIPFGCCICYFISPGIVYYTRMLQCIAVLYIFTAVLWERWLPGRWRDVAFSLLLCAAMNFGVMANICYNYIDRAYEQAYATMSEMSTRIHMEDDGNVTTVAILGELDQLPEDADIDNSQLGLLGPLKFVSKATVVYDDHILLFLDQYTGFTLSYYRLTGEEYPQVELSANDPLPAGYELRLPAATSAQKAELMGMEEVRQMPIWPARDSVRRVGDTIVVKLSQP